MRAFIHSAIAHPVMAVLQVASDAMELVADLAAASVAVLRVAADAIHEATSPEDAEPTEERPRALVASPVRCTACGETVGAMPGGLPEDQQRVQISVMAEMHRPKCPGGRPS